MRKAATLTITGLDSMSSADQRDLAQWLRDQADKIVTENVDDNYKAKFFVEERKLAA